jgi:hypothetical protein
LFDEVLEESSVIFPKSGMMRDGVLWEQMTSEHHTTENESGFWPTPDCQNHRDGTKLRKDNNAASGGRHGISLHHAVMWPTPAASDNRDRGNRSTPAIKRRIEKGKQVMLSMAVSSESGRLSPDWVEWLMAWPIGWSDLQPLAMDKFHEWQQQHSII